MRVLIAWVTPGLCKVRILQPPLRAGPSAGCGSIRVRADALMQAVSSREGNTSVVTLAITDSWLLVDLKYSVRRGFQPSSR